MMDVSKVNARLKEATEERDAMKQKLDIEVDARKQMEGMAQLIRFLFTEAENIFAFGHFVNK